MLASIAGLLVPLMRPTGLGDWRIVTSLISGFMAKESVVSVMEMLFNSPEGVAGMLTKVQASSLLVFSLIYTPCVAAIASIRREMGRGWAAGVVAWQCLLAWTLALIVRLIGMLL